MNFLIRIEVLGLESSVMCHIRAVGNFKQERQPVRLPFAERDPAARIDLGENGRSIGKASGG